MVVFDWFEAKPSGASVVASVLRQDKGMDKWVAGDWLAFLAVAIPSVIAVVAISFGIWAARRWGTRRGKVLLSYSVTSLLPSGAPRTDLAVTFAGFPVEDPHLVTLRLRNVGPHDITREHFDLGNPLLVGLNSKFMGLLSSTSSDGVPSKVVTTWAIGTENANIGLGPGLLPKKAEWVVEFLTQGTSVPVAKGRLINTDVVTGESTSRTVMKELVKMAAPWPLRSVISSLLD
jgi:hypothetical protein